MILNSPIRSSDVFYSVGNWRVVLVFSDDSGVNLYVLRSTSVNSYDTHWPMSVKRQLFIN